MRGGEGAGALGGVLGGVLGGGLGLALAVGICPIEIFGPGCSPRDEAFAVVAFLSGLVWGIALGVLAGSESGIDRWEALEQIRAERRRASTRRGQ